MAEYEDGYEETSRKTNKKRKAKRRKNWAILFTAYSFVAVFLVMMVYICVYATSHKEEMLNNQYNSHQTILAAQNIRGSILAQDGTVLASSSVDDGGTEHREYPYGNVFAHAVGYAVNGKAGIESDYNYYLINSNAALSERVSNEVSGRKVPGDNVYTTLDVDVQQAAYDALGVYKGAIVVTEPQTGKILAMVSKPDYDPTTIPEIWNDLLADRTNTVLLNRATQGLYPPGSTFKIITALEYLRENPSSYENYHFQCGGSFSAGDSTIRCYHGSSHGSVGFTKSFAKSCNSSFANMSSGFDKSDFAHTLDTLLFNQQLPVGFRSAVSHVEMDKDTLVDDVMQTAIGQGKDAMSPLHLNMITAAVANNGTMMTPYLVDRVENVDHTVIKRFASKKCGQVMTAEEATILQDLMKEVVTSGTGTKLSGQAYTAAGKTGSAEYNTMSDSHAWFTGFAPAEDPKICVTIVIEGAGSGGDYAVPTARRVFDAFFAEHPEFLSQE